jgi:hypothetical protein
MQTLSAGWTLLENSRRVIGKSPDIFCARNRPRYDCHVSQSNELMRPRPLHVSHDRELIEEPAVDATTIELMVATRRLPRPSQRRRGAAPVLIEAATKPKPRGVFRCASLY